MTVLTAAALLVPESLSAGAAEPRLPDAESPRERDARLQWWREARFGMFIHWGPASVSGKEISWARVGHPHDHPGLESVPAAEYDQLYRQFNPVKFDADRWMRLARDAGMKYVVFTTKHHDGFSLWPTRLRPDYSIAATPFRRDVCRAIADAAHRQGLKLGWYYSTRDWTHPDYLVGDNRQYDEFYRGQVRELLSDYGRVDIIWFDHVAGNWRDYRFQELFEMIYRLQPGILVNNRAAAFIRPTTDQPAPSLARLVRGDFDTPEQRIGQFDNQRPWESCVTMTECPDGGGWSYRPDGRTRRYEDCVRLLVHCAAGDGNLLLNVGPLPTGEIAADQQTVLHRMGRWLESYGESIYATRGGPVRNGDWGGTTYRDTSIYLHLLQWNRDTLRLPPLKARVLRVTALTGGEPQFQQSATSVEIRLPVANHDAVDTILKLELDAPAVDEFSNGQPLPGLSMVADKAGDLAAEASSPSPPPPELNLKLAAPIDSWDEAVPLGNGLMGGLLWGHDSTLRLSLDRGDLWDERPHGEPGWWTNRTYAKAVDLIAKEDFATVNQWWDDPYNGVTPTKLPAGRLEVGLDPSMRITSFELNLATAEGWAHLADGRKIEAFFSAKEPVALLRIPGRAPAEISLRPSGAQRVAGDTGPSSGGAVSRLGYPPAVTGQSGEVRWFEQEAAQGFAYAAAVGTRRQDDATLLAIAVTARPEGDPPRKVAEARVQAALERGFEALRREHAAWWREFWARSSIRLPPADYAIAQQYSVVRYFHGAASRRGAPPMPLQGVWTADSGGLPPWKGDYHNDLNTQMTYIAYPAAGHFEEGLSYLDFLWDRREVFAAFARDVYGTPGLACPGVMSLAGQPLGGWGMYSMSPTMSAWSAHLFYLHWRYTMDDEFLRQRAWPWCRDVGLCMKCLLRTNERGVLVLPLSSSPEVFDASPRAWLKPNSNYDLMCLRMLFLALVEMADAQGLTAEAREWAALSRRLGPYHAREDGTLKISANEDLPGSHRHLSNLMALHPFNLINVDNEETEQHVIAPTLAEWDKFGPGAWCGYSYSWMAALRARVGRAEEAVQLLDIFAKAFVLRNGFHANGDQTKSGFSGFTYRPFTLEGNFLAMHAVQEMLLQSWSPTPGYRDTQVIRIFPATPWRWHDVAFDNLRAEGGYRVSARRENNATTWFRIMATRDGVLRLRDTFGDRVPTWNRPGVRKAGANYEMLVRAGETLEATLPKPERVPTAPANAAEPVVIR